ncbi:MAG: hypothetical protein ACP5N7_01065 [Candidatus Pacearchaeota archaeon]
MMNRVMRKDMERGAMAFNLCFEKIKGHTYKMSGARINEMLIPFIKHMRSQGYRCKRISEDTLYFGDPNKKSGRPKLYPT